MDNINNIDEFVKTITADNIHLAYNIIKNENDAFILLDKCMNKLQHHLKGIVSNYLSDYLMNNCYDQTFTIAHEYILDNQDIIYLLENIIYFLKSSHSYNIDFPIIHIHMWCAQYNHLWVMTNRERGLSSTHMTNGYIQIEFVEYSYFTNLNPFIIYTMEQILKYEPKYVQDIFIFTYINDKVLI